MSLNVRRGDAFWIARLTGAGPDLAGIHRGVLLRTPCMDDTRTSESTRDGLGRGLIAGTMAAAGAIHLGQVQEHLEEWRLAGLYFVVIGLLQIAVGVAFAVAPTARLRIAALIISVPTALLWAASRSIGLPGGPHAGIPEAVDAAGLVATALELVTITVLVSWRSARAARRVPLPLTATMLAILFMVVGSGGATGNWVSECGGAHGLAGDGEQAGRHEVADGHHDPNYEQASDPNELLKDHAEHDGLDSFKRLEEPQPERERSERDPAAC